MSRRPPRTPPSTAEEKPAPRPPLRLRGRGTRARRSRGDAAATLALDTLDALDTNLAVLNAEGVIVSVNRAWREFADRNGGSWSAVGEGANYLEVCDGVEGPDAVFARKVAAAIRSILRGGATVFGLEYPCHAPDAERWFEVRVSPLPGRRPPRVVVVHKDVTDCRQALATLQLSEERFRVALAGAPLVVFNQDRDLRYTWVGNPTLGVSAEEILGRTDFDLHTPEFAGPLTELKRRVLETGVGIRQEFYVRRLQRGAWYDLTVEPLYDDSGRITGITGAAYDLTPAKQAQEKVRESEARLQLVLSVANEGVWDWDLRADRAYLSPKYYELTGYAPEDVVPNLEFFRRLVLPEDLPQVERTMTDHLEGRTPESVFDYRMVTRDGQVRWMAGRGRVVERDALGAPVRMMGTICDIGERRRAALDLETSRRALRALAARLQSAREDERVRISRVVHDELGHAFTDLKLDLAWLDRRLQEGGVPRARALRRRIREMTRRVEADLDVARRLSAELRPAVLDTLGLAAGLEWETRQFEARTGIRCEISLPEEPVSVDSRRSTALFRIFQEIMTNVARHAEAAKVMVRLAIGPSGVALEVADDGRGIPAAAVNNPLALGLLGMRERALELGGSVEIRGGAGRGTTVSVRLPGTPP